MAHLWRYVTVDLFWLLDLLGLALHRGVVLLLLVPHGGPPLGGQQGRGGRLPGGAAVVAAAVEVRLKVDADARRGHVLLHTVLLILCRGRGEHRCEGESWVCM